MFFVCINRRFVVATITFNAMNYEANLNTHTLDGLVKQHMMPPIFGMNESVELSESNGAISRITSSD